MEYTRAELEEGILLAWILPPKQDALSLDDEYWLKQFSLVGVSLLIVGWLADSSVTSFTFQEDNRHLWDLLTAASLD